METTNFALYETAYTQEKLKDIFDLKYLLGTKKFKDHNIIEKTSIYPYKFVYSKPWSFIVYRTSSFIKSVISL